MKSNEKLRVLIVHNAYQQRGGEDSVVEEEINLLRGQGHDVEIYSRSNDEVRGMTKVKLISQTIWSRRTSVELGGIIQKFKPDVLHAHNTFPLMSGSTYWVAHKYGVPTIQTIHNFRLMCIQGTFLRDQEVCEDCIGRTPLRGVLNSCYRSSSGESAVAGAALMVQRMLGTYRNKIDSYVALNEFCRNKLIEGGLPENRIDVKPNFVEMPDFVGTERNENPLFVGRLSHEKGVHLILELASSITVGQIDIAGDGPLYSQLKNHPQLNMLGSQSAAQVYELMRRAPFILIPSIWYENMPRTLVEAYACGTPVIASRLGAMEELVLEGQTGLLFEPSSVSDLERVIRYALANPKYMREMGRNALKCYQENYTGDRNYMFLMDIYRKAITVHQAFIGS